MNKSTKEFLNRLSELLDEYQANLEIEGDCWAGGPMNITLEVPNPESFEAHYNKWIAENASDKYPFYKQLYSSMDWVDLGWCVDASKLKELAK